MPCQTHIDLSDHIRKQPLAYFGNQGRADIDAAVACGDADTADLFTQISRENDKRLWLLEAPLPAD